MNTQSYDCHRKPDNCDEELLTQIGDFSWRYYPRDLASDDAGRLAGMVIRMPLQDGTGDLTWTDVKQPGREHGWNFDGNLDKPTLKPSLLYRKDQWHGYMTAGRLVSC